MTKLFFDIQITGHHSEYIDHILSHIIDDKVNKYIFVVHQDFASKFPVISAKAQSKSNVALIQVNANEILNIKVKNRFKRSLNNFKVVDHYAKKFNADEVFLLHLNVFQIALGLKKINYKISGILFMQFTNMKVNNMYSFYFYIRRYFPFILMLKQKKINQIFLLNDEDSANFLNNKYNTKIFKELPDPIPNIPLLKDFSISEFSGFEKKRKFFLHFGAISERKGSLEILEAIFKLPAEIQAKLGLVFAGKSSDSNFTHNIEFLINKINKETKARVLWVNSFVENTLMSSMFKASDVILMPYKNAEASSGIMGHAIKYKKPIISTNSGLIGKIINQNNFGFLIDSVTPNEIANAIELSYKKEVIITSKQYDLYLKSHSVKLFSKKILC